MSLDNKVTVHKHLYAVSECVVTFKDLTVEESDFMIYWLSTYFPTANGLKGDLEMERLGIQIVIDETGNLTPPPSNVIHFMVSARFIESFKKGYAYVFAKVQQRFDFDILYDKKSDLGINGYCKSYHLSITMRAMHLQSAKYLNLEYILSIPKRS